METSQIDFGECYKNVQNNYSIEDNLVLGIINKKVEGKNYPKISSFSMYEPDKGNELYINDICENDLIIIKENVKIKLDPNYNYDFFINLVNQDIDIFNILNDFYNDICYHYESPINKDISLKDRILLFFPNVTLCENGCTNKGIDIELMRAKCECIFNDLINNNMFSNNYWYQNQIGEIQEIIAQTNLAIMKCFKEFFKYKYFISCIGGYIFIFLLMSQIIITIIFFTKSLYLFRKYIF